MQDSQHLSKQTPADLPSKVNHARMLFTAAFVFLLTTIVLQLGFLLWLGYTVPPYQQFALDFKILQPESTIFLMDLSEWIVGRDQLIPGWICFAIWELGLIVVLWGMVKLGAAWGTPELDRMPRLLQHRFVPDLAIAIAVTACLTTALCWMLASTALDIPFETMILDIISRG